MKVELTFWFESFSEKLGAVVRMDALPANPDEGIEDVRVSTKGNDLGGPQTTGPLRDFYVQTNQRTPLAEKARPSMESEGTVVLEIMKSKGYKFLPKYDVHVPDETANLDGSWRAKFDVTWFENGKENTRSEWCVGKARNVNAAQDKIYELQGFASTQGFDVLTPYFEKRK